MSQVDDETDEYLFSMSTKFMLKIPNSMLMKGRERYDAVLIPLQNCTCVVGVASIGSNTCTHTRGNEN